MTRRKTETEVRGDAGRTEGVSSPPAKENDVPETPKITVLPLDDGSKVFHNDPAGSAVLRHRMERTAGIGSQTGRKLREMIAEHRAGARAD